VKKTILKTDLFAKTDDITEDKDKSQKIQTVEDSGEKTLSAVSITKEKVQKKDKNKPERKEIQKEALTGYAKQFFLRFPAEYHIKASELASSRMKEGKPMSLNAWIIEAIEEKIERDQKSKK